MKFISRKFDWISKNILEYDNLSDAKKKLLENRVNNLTRKVKEMIKLRERYKLYLPERILAHLLYAEETYSIRDAMHRYSTAMIVDIHNFTKISEKLDAERVLKIENNLFSTLYPVIQKFRGSIISYLGDAIIILFGIFDDKDGGELTAIKCAIQILNKIKELDISMPTGYEKLTVSITINSGETISIRLGSQERMQYYIMGRSIIDALEFQKLALHGRILVGPLIYEKLKHIYMFEKNIESKNTFFLKH